MRLPLAAVLLVLAPPVLADSLPSGTYAATTDGGSGSIAVVGQLLTIAIGGNGCAGGLTGVLDQEASDVWNVSVPAGDGMCTLGFVREGDGYSIEEGPGCSYWHGASCAFSGAMVQTGGSSDPAAMREAFESFQTGERKAIQDVLGQLGFYRGAVDGAYGPATAAALAQLP